MGFAKYFVTRPIGTALLALALAVAGFLSFRALPAAPLPEVEFPTISVRAALPGADPETMANAVATPLERRLGHIAGVSEMTSVSEVGFTRIVLQFSLDRDIDGAARDVQAAIDASKSDLPKDMPQNPLYYKSNPADAPIMVLSLTSVRASPTEMFDVASTVLQQRLLRTPGVGEVGVGGGALPAVRVQLDPDQLAQHGIALADMRQFLIEAAPARALGNVVIGSRQYTIGGNDNLLRAKQYAQLDFRTRDGGVVHLSDLAQVRDSVEDVRNSGIANGKSAVLLIVYKQPGANVIDTVASIKAQLPFLKASIPADIDISLIGDRTPAIHASLADIEFTLLMSIGLVMLVTLAFFRDWRSAIVPSIALPLALLGTFAVMYLVGFSLNILSLMALAISTGFVVDDAIVVVENVMRHIEQGKTPFAAAVEGTAEVSFTIVSITLSLLAAFIPLLLMGGIVGRLFREFSVSMSVAVALSMLLSLTLTPMLCRLLIRAESGAGHTPPSAAPLTRLYDRSLSWALDHPVSILLVALGTTVASAALFAVIPKGFFPMEDTGRIGGVLYVSQASSFTDVHEKLQQVIERVRRDPDVANVVGYAGTGLVPNSATVFMYLKPEQARHATSDEVIARLLKESASIPDLHLYLQPAQDLVLGGRRTAAQYQYTFNAENLDELNHWSPALIRAVRRTPGVTQVNSNAATGGRQSFLQINRQLAARYGTDVNRIDETLYDAFGQRRLDVLYQPGNEYRVVMEADPRLWSAQDALERLRVPADCLACEASGRRSHAARAEPASTSLVPLSALGAVLQRHTPLLINHTGQFPSETISFNLTPGTSLGDATRAIAGNIAKLGLPGSVSGSFTGSARVFEDSLKAEPLLIGVALAAVYLILGILYEDLVHPLTILSSLPPAGLGALLTLSAFHIELSVMALIGLILLIGIVKKNAIMLVDFALALQRERGHDPRSAIHEACLVRARPILMTTLAAMLGALPLVFGTGYGAEFRKPLGLTIVGGLVLSQLVTLYTTPVVFLMLARIRKTGRPPHS